MTGSLWLRGVERPRYEPLREPIRVEVAVIGGGIAGLTAALLLKRGGMRVAVLEKGRFGEGETGRTTAHLTQLLDSPYSRLRRDFGKEGARAAAESARAAIDRIERNVEDFGIDCGFARVPGYVYTERRRGLRFLEKEARAMRKIGLDPETLHEAPLPFRTRGALRLGGQAQFHPMRYLRALAARVDGGGSRVFERTQAVAIEDGKPCRVRTPRGDVQADFVLSAADAPVSSPYVLQTRVQPYRTYAIGATGASLVDGLFYDTADPYHYIRSHDGVLILGGEDHRVGERRDTLSNFGALERFARERFDMGAIPYRWSGQVMEPVDGLPYIGKSPFARRVYVATGFSGTGMTFGTLAGMICSDLILGQDNPWAELYDPARLTVRASAVSFVAGNADYPKCLVRDWLAPGEAASAAEIPPGEGKLVRDGLTKSAVYRDPEGRLHSVSAVCPHMGCMVRFNRAETSWDCPCHGSRFSVDGELLHGPAMTGLAKTGAPGAAIGPTREPVRLPEPEREPEERKKAA